MSSWAHDLDAVVFDAFGTLVERRLRRDPIKRLLALAEPKRAAIVAHDVMRSPTAWTDWVADLDLAAHPDLPKLHADLQAETAAVAARPAAMAFWPRLHTFRLRLGLCSNLAEPYVAPCLQALPGPLDAYTWSCHVGAIKPEPAIYAHAARAVGAEPARILFVGDRAAEDIDGPQRAGFRAMHIDAFAKAVMEQP